MVKYRVTGPEGFKSKRSNLTTVINCNSQSRSLHTTAIRTIRLSDVNIEIGKATSRIKTRLFMYNRDKSILYFSSEKRDFIVNLKINFFTLEKHIIKGTYYLGKYYFIFVYLPTAKNKEMLIEDVLKMLENDRLKFIRKF
jgi:hypothetical protein